MNEREALRYAANLLRTLASMAGGRNPAEVQAGLLAARMLDRYNERPPDVPPDAPPWPWEGNS
jgi:hypothetical protein